MFKWLMLIVAGVVVATMVGLGVAHTIWSMGARDALAAAQAQARAFNATGFTAADLSDAQRHILLTVEDPDFYNHHGVDMSTPGAGLTTVTQALSKKLFFEQFHPGLAKIRQTSLAFTLDGRMSKADQLTLFVNLAPLGRGPDGAWVTGFPDGARAFFGKDVGELSDDEFVALTARLIAPGAFSQPVSADALAERVARIKRLLAGECAPKGLRDVEYADCATGARRRGAARDAERISQ